MPQFLILCFWRLENTPASRTIGALQKYKKLLRNSTYLENVSTGTTDTEVIVRRFRVASQSILLGSLANDVREDGLYCIGRKNAS